MIEMLLVTPGDNDQPDSYLEHVLEKKIDELPPEVRALLPSIASAIGSSRIESAVQQLDMLIDEVRDRYSTNVQSPVLGGAIVAQAILTDSEAALELLTEDQPSD